MSQRGVSLDTTMDTSAEAARVQAEIYRRLGPDGRVAIAFALSGAVRELARERIRMRFPELDEIGVRDRLVWEMYGIRLPRRASEDADHAH